MSQAVLAEYAGVGLNDVQAIERLRMITGRGRGEDRFRDVAGKLNKVAAALELDFDDLFPSDYLETLQGRLLPGRPRPVPWLKEVSLETLPEADLPCPPPADESTGRQLLQNILYEAVRKLEDTERRILELRFGLRGSDPISLEQVAEAVGVSPGTALQLQTAAMSRLRRPTRKMAKRKRL